MATVSTGILAHRRFAGEHDSIRTVINGIGHVRDFGASRARILDHGFEHLGCRNDRLAELRSATNDVLLNRRHLLRRHFHAEIATRNHDGVGSLQNRVEMLDGLWLFQLGNDPAFAAESSNAVANQAHIFSGTHKRDSDGIHARLESKLKSSASFSVSEGTRTGIPGRLMPLFSPSIPPLMISQTTSSP